MSEPEFEYLGPYRVQSTLGRGGMGTVYKGVHARSGEAIAIKVIASGVANSSRFRRRFASEIETLQRLKHPHIVSLVGFGEEQGLLFYTMEYVDGHSLHEHLRQHNKMPWQEVVQIGIETASALKHAHDLGIIHRDLKPANLMLNTSGKIKLTDFGIAKLFGSTDMTAAGSVIGTADYMPPEQAEGKPVTVRSDLYSLGGVLYALLCGKAPFGGKSVPEVLYAVRYNTPQSIQEIAPEVPDELAELIHELLRKDIQKRPPTALVVGNRLKAMLQGLSKRQTAQPDAAASSDEPPALPDETQIGKIGTHLTSLDLSDVEDEDLKLTGEVLSQMGLAPEEPADAANEATSKSSAKNTEIPAGEPANKADSSASDDTRLGNDDIGTRDQQTMLAPDDLELPPLNPEPGERSKVERVASKEVELSGEFGVSEPIPSTDATYTGMAGKSHYTSIEDKMAQPVTLGIADEPKQEDATDWVQVGSIVGLVVLLVGSIGFGIWMLQPVSADELYDQIQIAADSGDEGQLLAARNEIEAFLGRFPNDERVPEVQALADETELARWTRVLRRRASSTLAANRLSAVEQAFLECMNARERGSRREAEARMDAFLGVFGQIENLDSREARYVRLIEFAQKAGGKPTAKTTSKAAEQLEQLVQAAEESLDAKQLERYYKDLILLYDDKDWAAEQIDRIQRKLSSK